MQITMSDPQNCRSSSTKNEDSRSPPDILISEGDERFFRSLYEFIEHEKKFLQCPEEGPDELRYVIYRSAFNKVITRATAYRRLLLTIKMGYDDIISALQTRKDEARMTQRTVEASTSHTKSLMTCQRRAAQLRERISTLQRDTAELVEDMERQKSSKRQSMWIPGLTVAGSEDPEALDGHLKHLEAQRAALLDRKSHCVPLEVKAELNTKLQAAECRRDQLRTENNRLRVLYERLRLVSDRLSSWEAAEQQVPLEELLVSTRWGVRQTSGETQNKDLQGQEATGAELFEDEEPTGVDESKLLTDYLDRFTELFDSSQFEEAAFLAARSPRGVLRNLDAVEMFKGVKGPPGSAPPLLLFFRALLMTVPAGDQLPAALSLQAVHCVLQHGATQLVSHAVTHNKLTFSEELGDLLTEHAQQNPRVRDLCLALATDVYEACRLERKSALSMCRRGLIHSATELMRDSNVFTAEDCMWVLCRSPSLSLLKLLTEPQQGQVAILSVGGACGALLADPQQQELALQLLDSFVSRGRGVLEEVILEDCSSSPDVWTHMASVCSELNRADLSQAILSVLLDQSGTRVLTPDLEGARLMEHVFL